jgi:hypothetical protein
MLQSRRAPVLVLFGLGALLSLVARLEVLRATMRERAAALTSTRDSLRRVSIEKQLLVDALGRTLPRLASEGVALVGHDERDGSPVVLAKGTDHALYFLSPYCAHCAANVDTLNAWRRSGHTVVGISVRGSTLTVTEWMRRHDVHFPVLADAAGAVVDAVRSESTPVTLHFKRGRLVDFQLGRLTTLR